MAPLPVTVLTGFLGAGKTSLLNRLLTADPGGRRTLVIVNEFGEAGIDGELIDSGPEEIFELSNGCVCCTVRGDLIRTLYGLLPKLDGFDSVLIETTGLADPGPVVQTFLADAVLRAAFALDGVTTVVDAVHIAGQCAAQREAREQIAFADQIVLGKTDLLPPEGAAAAEAVVRAINPFAEIHRAVRGAVPPERLLGRGGFDLARIAAHLTEDADPPCGPDCEHDHHHHDHHHPGHAPEIGSLTLRDDRPMDAGKIEAFLAAYLADNGQDVLRAKGIVNIGGEPRKLVFHSVHSLLEGDFAAPWRPEEARTSRLVFIGRNLNAHTLQAGFSACAQ